MVASLSRARGWDFEHLASGRGPLASVSDWSLAVLVQAFRDELAAIDLECGGCDELPALTPANVDAAMAELRGAMG